MLDVELQSISRVLRVALRKTIIKKLYKITVFLNFQMAIKKIQRFKIRADWVLKAQIIKKAKKFQSKSSKITV